MAEKNLPATARRLREARKKGQVARSADVTRALVLTGMLVWLGLLSNSLVHHLSQLLKDAVTRPVDEQGVLPAAMAMLEPHLFALFVPPLIFMFMFSLTGDFLQVRGVFSLEPLAPKMERMNPAEGFKRVFSARSLVTLGLSTVKMGLVLLIAWLLLADSLNALTVLTYRSPQEVLRFAGGLLFKLFAFVLAVQIIGAVLDFGYQNFDFLKKMRMSIDELRRELKETEGDPYQRAQRRALGRDAAYYAAVPDRNTKEEPNVSN